MHHCSGVTPALSTLIYSKKKPFHHRGTPTIKGPLYLILPQKYCHKIKYETTSHSRQTVLDSPRPGAAYCSGGEETTRVEKDDKRVELATRTAFNSHPPAARCYESQYAPYSHRNNFRDGAARHGGRTTRREAET
ncbi:hypothetical protein JTE90_020209 [Oedothorax gibbosus]|uniref:Uncharacterized protein n=1 Tax=Oedothorax gibbosus TaxID=931172 RepID=A0AAV6TF18_9ARAC|nr:hypothetical protein JTE90_020209 [Oedothorax gibbosus]